MMKMTKEPTYDEPARRFHELEQKFLRRVEAEKLGEGIELTLKSLQKELKWGS